LHPLEWQLASLHGQKAKYSLRAMSSGLPPKADSSRTSPDVSNVPTPELAAPFDHLVVTSDQTTMRQRLPVTKNSAYCSLPEQEKLLYLLFERRTSVTSPQNRK